MSISQTFLSDKQVAARYGISRPSVWRWLASGLLPPPLRVGPHTTRWRLADLEQFEEGRAEKDAADRA